MAKVTLRYWAALRAAAGTPEESYDAATLAEALAAAKAAHGADSRFAAVLAICAVLVDETPLGKRDPEREELGDGSVVDLLPPFAGG
ncbi:MoaD/ThiS family protein [Phytoactinopolyspora alkaliphila]|uniref:MoaD/ThiS family protein n=1 Tax=Phytoactinopolyspora alkaliphila TaxID=1783498 RepID=A0A6N9YJ55_9ACTN|nr:MoaD/ThiS family protein [Phytoactinopolyspora alkaliphila]NED94965.1 MoaD/ThiS family protein [Phytoactinopolyspora alkaliphila]